MVKLSVEGRANNRPTLREFTSWEALFKSAFLHVKFLGEPCWWWDDCTVRFEDKKSGSCSMVEIVNGKTVTVGFPAYYCSWHLKTRKAALEAADKIAQSWLDWEDEKTWQQFVDQVEILEEASV